jgi:hypothetical protein
MKFHEEKTGPQMKCNPCMRLLGFSTVFSYLWLSLYRFIINFCYAVHDLVVYRFGGILGSVRQRVKIHKITPTAGKERGDTEIKDYGLAKTPRTDRQTSLDLTLTHTCFGRSPVHSLGHLTHTRRSDGSP